MILTIEKCQKRTERIEVVNLIDPKTLNANYIILCFSTFSVTAIMNGLLGENVVECNVVTNKES